MINVWKQALLGGVTQIIHDRCKRFYLSNHRDLQSVHDVDTMSSGLEKNRGREAEQPSEIPRPGWRDIFLRVKREMEHDNLSIVAAGVAFYSFLAIFPAIAAFVSIYGLVTNPTELGQQLQSLETVLPREAAEVINTELHRIVGAQQSGLSWGALGGLILALWSAAKGMSAMLTALNIVYDEEEKRGLIYFNAMALILTLAGILFGLVFLSLVVGVPLILQTIGIGEIADPLVNYLRWPLLALGSITALQGLYRYGPSRCVLGGLGFVFLWLCFPFMWRISPLTMRLMGRSA